MNEFYGLSLSFSSLGWSLLSFQGKTKQEPFYDRSYRLEGMDWEFKILE